MTLIDLTPREYREVLDIDAGAFRCSVCDRQLVDHPHCPDCCPDQVPGLERVECPAGVHRMWIPATDAYPPPCYPCLDDEEAQARMEADRCRHWPWRRWRVARWLARWAYALGVIAGSGSVYGNGHTWCLTSVSWRGRRPYVLGWPDWKWSCLLRGRHWPGEHIGLGACGKCLPQPRCSSTAHGHRSDCDAEGI